MSLGICRQQSPTSACASMQSDQGLPDPLIDKKNHWILQNVRMESKGWFNTLHILGMFEGTF